MKKMSVGTLEGTKSLYEALGELQQRITNTDDFEHRNEFREDWRGYKFEEDCLCDRCMRFKGA